MINLPCSRSQNERLDRTFTFRNTRANVTSELRYRDAAGATKEITTEQRYYDTGDVSEVTDAPRNTMDNETGSQSVSIDHLLKGATVISADSRPGSPIVNLR